MSLRTVRGIIIAALLGLFPAGAVFAVKFLDFPVGINKGNIQNGGHFAADGGFAAVFDTAKHDIFRQAVGIFITEPRITQVAAMPEKGGKFFTVSPVKTLTEFIEIQEKFIKCRQDRSGIGHADFFPHFR